MGEQVDPPKAGRIRRRPITFGNPSLGTYEGAVFTLKTSNGHVTGATDLLPPSTLFKEADRVAAMVQVPPEQVPEGVLHFARAYRSYIEHVRIVISSGPKAPGTTIDQQQQGETTISMEEESSLRSTPRASNTPQISAQQSPVATKPSRSKSADEITIASPSSSPHTDAAAIFASDSPASTDNRATEDANFRQNLLDDSNKTDRTYLLLFLLSSAQACRDFIHDLDRKPYTSLDETQVANLELVVGLEGHNGVSLLSPIFAPSNELRPTKSGDGASTPSGNTSRSLRAEDATEVHNCAVCLEPLEEDQAEKQQGILTTVCNHSFHLQCFWQCMDSPCPVCRYDHAGLNEALSQCHVCGTTQHNYVCLICGVVSCAVASVARAPSSQREAPTVLSLGHARQHYDETLHAYALDTETQHVWDFAGQGYVHRLLQNAQDGKLVEVAQQGTGERQPEAGHLSDQQEDEVVHRKLEGLANQYYALLKSQLEQQRIYYENRLEELQREGNQKTSETSSLIAALKQERRQLQQRLGTLRERYQIVSEEVSFLKNLNESLETNKEQMKRQVQEAQRERDHARAVIQQALPPLEERLYHLMLQLEEDSKPAAT